MEGTGIGGGNRWGLSMRRRVRMIEEGRMGMGMNRARSDI